MIKVIKLYNDLTQQFEDWVFRHVVPPVLKIVEIALKLTLFYSFYLLIVNTINELF